MPQHANAPSHPRTFAPAHSKSPNRRPGSTRRRPGVRYTRKSPRAVTARESATTDSRSAARRWCGRYPTAARFATLRLDAAALCRPLCQPPAAPPLQDDPDRRRHEASPPPGPRRRQTSSLDRFQLEELFDRQRPNLTADPRFLVAAKRRQHVEAAAVDVNLPGTQLLRHCQRALLGARPHAAGQAILRVVRDRDRLFFRVVRNDRQHRPEDLLLRHRHLVVDIREDGGLDVEPFGQVRRLAATSSYRCALLLALLDVLEHRVALGG